MYVPLKITTDNSLLKSTIKIDELLNYSLKNDIKTLSIVDDNLYGVIEFYLKCQKNNIKPIIGLCINILELPIYLYARNYQGYQNLLQIHIISNKREISLIDLEMYLKDILIIIPVLSLNIYDEIKKLTNDLYIGYQNEYEKTTAYLKSKKIVFVNDVRSLKKEDTKYLDYLEMIRTDTLVNSYEKKNYEKNYLLESIDEFSEKTTLEFANLIDISIPLSNNYTPIFDSSLKDSYLYLENLTKKGLFKRMNGKVPLKYKERLEYELSVIKKMGFVDYILIVYDYVLFAKKNNILVGPGRGSAVGSLVCYTLGITDIDPLKYNLLFERFLNPERVSMPDIDIDFENIKREEVINYIVNRYGFKNVAKIMSFQTLKPKLALRDVSKILLFPNKDLEVLLKEINPNISLEENIKLERVKKIVLKNNELKNIYKIAYRLEGIKKNISIHAAGVVISKTPLDLIVPIISSSDYNLCCVTKEYLEDLGLLKMDILAISNLTIIANILELIKNDTNEIINLNKIDLEDESVIDIFRKADTTGIFQFESTGMKNFLQKLKPTNFSELVASIALYRPGPMENINTFIKRKEGLVSISYLTPSLKDILEETKGIIVYQEQVMQILVKIANYSYAEADLIRRAMSKKNKDIIEGEREKFISRSLQNGISKEISIKIYELILKFANYGFNKSHSVSYALIGYQMAYLKVKYKNYFLTNLLNMSIGSEIKTKEYLTEAKLHKLKLIRPNINKSEKLYQIKDNNLILPLSIIKGLNDNVIKSIIDERNLEGEFKDFINFVMRMEKYNLTLHNLEILINAGVFLEFNNYTTLKENLSAVKNYAVLSVGIKEPLLMPVLKEYPEAENKEELEFNSYGFYITNHPASIYKEKDIIKIDEIKKYFDKQVKVVVLIESIKRIKTKKNEDMAFILASDENGTCDFVIFNKEIKLLDNVFVKDLVLIYGKVTKRFDKYQININNLIKIKG